MYIKRKKDRKKILLQQDRRILTTSDLAILWETTNKNTLLTTIKRYTKSKILHRIQKGLYSTIPIPNLHPYELGCAVSGSLSYISTETVLQNAGIIMQHTNKITLLGPKTKQFTINNIDYLCRYLHPKFLLNRIEINQHQPYHIATTNRAITDSLHINPQYHFDNQLAINHKTITKLRKQLGYI